MAYNTFTVGLNLAEFPFISDFFARSVMVPQLDIPPRVTRTNDVGSVESRNPELAQHLYAQNVMPATEGLMSVGYVQLLAAIPGATDFDQVITLRDEDENNFLFAPAGGKNYIMTALSGTWAPHSSFVATPGSLVTRAYVNGRTFVCYESQRVLEYDFATDTLNTAVIVGLPAQAEGISASNNYMLAWVGLEVHWSSLIDPLDMVPSIQTGAGFAIPQDVKGPIRSIVPISGGFIIYTTKNAVAALYTNNARAPFVFKEVSNTGGILDPEQISLDATVGFHYGWTSNGLQKITANTSEPVSGAASDFLAGRILETFDTITNLLTVQRLTTNVHVKVTHVSGRYLVVSYGKDVGATPQLFSHAIVFDTVLKRWGKLLVDHSDCFTYPYPTIPGVITQSPHKQSLAFLQADGTILQCVLDYRDQQDVGVLILGKFQLVRQKNITFQTCEFESLIDAYPPDVYLLVSLDGRNMGTPQQLQVIKDNGNYKKYGAPAYSGTGAAPARSGVSLCLLVKGTFELAANILTVTQSGNR